MMSGGPPSRRVFLKSGAIALTTVLAGCSGGGGDSTPGSDDTPTQSDTQTSTSGQTQAPGQQTDTPKQTTTSQDSVYQDNEEDDTELRVQQQLNQEGVPWIELDEPTTQIRLPEYARKFKGLSPGSEAAQNVEVGEDISDDYRRILTAAATNAYGGEYSTSLWKTADEIFMTVEGYGSGSATFAYTATDSDGERKIVQPQFGNADDLSNQAIDKLYVFSLG